MIRVLCPSCDGGRIALPDVAVARETLACEACGVAYPSYFGVLDLRQVAPKAPTCWDDTRTVPEAELEQRLVDRFQDADVGELGRVYAQGFTLPPVLAAALETYQAKSGQRESWPIRHMDNCARRLAGRPLGGGAALEAGCGSGGALTHLAQKYPEVAGQDTDLGSLMVAARRARDAGLEQRVTLVAAPLETRVFDEGAFDLVKCTDVIEHVADPVAVARNLSVQLALGGILFMLTPNKWSLTTPEPHVRLWGVNLMPRSLANNYVRRRIGLEYEHVANLLSYRGMRRLLEGAGGLRVMFVPVEDKRLNPDSPRGRALRGVFQAPPLRWGSAGLRYVQPVLEALCVKEKR